MAASTQNRRTLRFNGFEVDPRSRELRRNGSRVRLQDQPLEVLLLLLERQGELVTREELKDKLWPVGTFVDSDDGLNTAIKKLRDVLHDSLEQPRYIETIPRHGYRFIGALEPEGPALHELTVKPSEEWQPVSQANPVGNLNRRSLFPWNGDVADDVALLHRPITRVTADDTTSENAPGKDSKTRRLWLLGTFIFFAGLFFAIWWVHRPLLQPLITDTVQITHNGHADTLAGSDGTKLYFNQILPSSPFSIAQVGIASREIVPLSVGLPDPTVHDVSADGTALLVSSPNNGRMSLWSVEIAGGALRLLAPDGFFGAWSPDGKSLIYSTSGGEIFVSRSDGTGARILIPAEALGQKARSWGFAWSPDGSKIRFSALSNARLAKLFEMSSDGSGLHELLPGWRPSSGQYWGRWTPDGRFYLFLSESPRTIGSSIGDQIWVLDERRGLYRKSPPEPVLLSSGAIQWDAPIPSKDGKRIFSLGTTLHGELVRYDTQSHQFQPFLGGISAEFVAFSPDGKSIVYVSFPDGILWKANRDGSSPRQLTDYALYATFPRWSPDGSKILLNRGSKAYLNPSSGGGSPEPILPDDKGDQNEPNWSPDGSRIVFSTGGQGEIKSDIRILSLASQKVSILPGSVGMFSPRWSPDGRLIAALDVSSLDLKVFKFETKKWSLLQKGPAEFPAFSHDGRFIYFVGYGVFRIRTSGGDAEPVVNLGFSFTGFYGRWMGLDPEDAPMLLRDTGTSDIYALTLEQK